MSIKNFNMNSIKYILVLAIVINIYGCCSTKTATSNTTKKETAMVEPTTEIETETETETEIEIIENTEDTIDETPDTTANENIVATPVVLEDPMTNDTNGIRAKVDHAVWNELLQAHVSNQGNVDYKGFQADKTKFNGYLNLLSDLPPQESWSKDETLAYWINVYNAYTIKLILDNYPIKSIKDIKGPWSHRFIRIGEKWYTLNDVEHRIIRKMDEPRIHFALVCAAVSCPRLYNKAFTEKDLEADLDLLTRGFLSDTSKNELSENAIKLSRIFKWYGGDFKSDGSTLIDFLNQYSTVTISDKAKKSYKAYNWNLNE